MARTKEEEEINRRKYVTVKNDIQVNVLFDCAM